MTFRDYEIETRKRRLNLTGRRRSWRVDGLWVAVAAVLMIIAAEVVLWLI